MQELDPLGSPDARFGLFKGQSIVDLSANCLINKRTEAFVNVNNNLDKQSSAGRLTDSPRPDVPLQASISMGLRF
tara:strand:+ start:9551 stop:9775 length:225 start_codon:yes stop_codon:yes gene_type:complete